VTTPTPGTYTLEQAEQDIAGLQGQVALVQDIIQTVSDKALLLYAPGANSIPRGPSSWSWEDGTVDSWTATNGAVTNSTVSVTGWPTAGTHSLLLTCNGGGAPSAQSPTGLNAVATQPGDIVDLFIDLYCPAAEANLYVAINWVDDTGTLLSSATSSTTSFSAGQIATLNVSGTAPDLTSYFYVSFGSTSTLANGKLIYADNVNVLGNLAISASPGGGTDSVGNPYDAGYEVQGNGTIKVKGYAGQSITSSITSGIPKVSLSTGLAEEGQAANFQAQTENPGSSEYMTCFLAGPQGSTYVGEANIALSSDNKDGSGNGANGRLNWVDDSNSQHLWLEWSQYGISVFNPNSGDSNTYQTERLTQNMSGNNAVTINTTNFSQQILQTAHVGVGTYHLRGQLCISPNQAAGSASYEIVAGSAVAGMRILFQSTTVEGTGTGLNNTAWVTGFSSAFADSTFGADDRVITFDGTLVVSTAGTIGMFAKTSATADTYSVYGYGSYWELFPIGPA